MCPSSMLSTGTGLALFTACSRGGGGVPIVPVCRQPNVPALFGVPALQGSGLLEGVTIGAIVPSDSTGTIREWWHCWGALYPLLGLARGQVSKTFSDYFHRLRDEHGQGCWGKACIPAAVRTCIRSWATRTRTCSAMTVI